MTLYCPSEISQNTEWPEIVEDTLTYGTCPSGYIYGTEGIVPQRMCEKGGVWSQHVSHRCGKPKWNSAYVFLLSAGSVFFVFILISIFTSI